MTGAPERSALRPGFPLVVALPPSGESASYRCNPLREEKYKRRNFYSNRCLDFINRAKEEYS